MNRSARSARFGVEKSASSYTSSFSVPFSSRKNPDFFVYSPYADSVTGFDRSISSPVRTRRDAAESMASVRRNRNRISPLAPAPLVRLRPADPSKGRYQRSYRCWAITPEPSLA